MWTSQPNRARWQIVAGLPRIDTMDGRGERCDYRNPKDSCEDRQSHMRTPSVAPVGIVVHGQHPLKHQSTQLRETGSAKHDIGNRPSARHCHRGAADNVGHDLAATAFPKLVETVNPATCRACGGRSWSHGILFGSTCCESKENLRWLGRLRRIAANHRSPQ